MGIVGINNFVFTSGINTMTISANAIDNNIEQWESMGESSIALQAYIDEYIKLQNIMSCYKKLVLKDVAAVNAIGVSLNDMDSKMAKVWEK